jgi:hypothetical protein
MSQPYFIPSEAPEGFAAAVFAVSYERPLDSRFDIEENLAARGVTGLVLIDMLMANASATRRYYSLPFDGEMFGHQAARVTASAGLEAYSRRVFQESSVPWDRSLLWNEELRALFHG